MTNFWSIVADFKRKPYELLDFHQNQFDRDYLEFNANIHELEAAHFALFLGMTLYFIVVLII